MLTISLVVGDGFWLLRKGKADERWEMKEVFLSRGFVLAGPGGVEYEINPEEELEIAPGVWVSDGHRVIVGKARVVFAAPQEVVILRDELYVERKKREAAEAEAAANAA